MTRRLLGLDRYPGHEVRLLRAPFRRNRGRSDGSAALRLTAMLEEPIEIRQGRGSLLSARPVDADRAASADSSSKTHPSTSPHSPP